MPASGRGWRRCGRRIPAGRGKARRWPISGLASRGAFLPGDTRANLLIDLGFAPPPPIASLAGPDRFFTPLSPEDLAPLEAGVLVWMGDSGDASALAALPLRRTLRAHAEGREIWADPMLAVAMSHASLSSLPYALDRLEPELAAAADGDPATPVPSAVAAGLAP